MAFYSKENPSGTIYPDEMKTFYFQASGLSMLTEGEHYLVKFRALFEDNTELMEGTHFYVNPLSGCGYTFLLDGPRLFSEYGEGRILMVAELYDVTEENKPVPVCNAIKRVKLVRYGDESTQDQRMLKCI